MARRVWCFLATGLTVVSALTVSHAAGRPPRDLPAPPQQEVVRSLELYGRGNFDAAVAQLIVGQKITALSRSFRRQAEAWIASAPSAERPARLAVTAAMVVEMMAASFTRDIFEYRGVARTPRMGVRQAAAVADAVTV